MERTGDTAILVWDTPGSELPQSAIYIMANDSIGAATIHAISVVLCACVNNGTCNNATTPMFNANGHFRQECQCMPFFSGELCENDERGCSEDSCPESSICVEDSSVEAGYNCSSCQIGYELADDGKCTGEQSSIVRTIPTNRSCTVPSQNYEQLFYSSTTLLLKVLLTNIVTYTASWYILYNFPSISWLCSCD